MDEDSAIYKKTTIFIYASTLQFMQKADQYPITAVDAVLVSIHVSIQISFRQQVVNLKLLFSFLCCILYSRKQKLTQLIPHGVFVFVSTKPSSVASVICGTFSVKHPTNKRDIFWIVTSHQLFRAMDVHCV